MQTQAGEITDPDEDWICEETAWGVIEQRGWIAGPELLFALKQYVREVLEERKWREAEAQGLSSLTSIGLKFKTQISSTH